MHLKITLLRGEKVLRLGDGLFVDFRELLGELLLALVGLMTTLVTTGSVFSTVASAVPVAVPPSASVELSLNRRVKSKGLWTGNGSCPRSPTP